MPKYTSVSTRSVNELLERKRCQVEVGDLETTICDARHRPHARKRAFELLLLLLLLKLRQTTQTIANTRLCALGTDRPNRTLYETGAPSSGGKRTPQAYTACTPAWTSVCEGALQTIVYTTAARLRAGVPGPHNNARFHTRRDHIEQATIIPNQKHQAFSE